MLRIERAVRTDVEDIRTLLDAAGLPQPMPELFSKGSSAFLLAKENGASLGFATIPHDEVPFALSESQEFSIHSCANAACMYRRIPSIGQQGRVKA